MQSEFDEKVEEKTLSLIKKILVALGGGLILAGVSLQWPIAGKSYMEFIEGDGYLALMLGLVMTVLGISVKLLIGQEKD